MNESIKDCRDAILEDLKWKIENDEKIYFSDIVSENVDNEISTLSTDEAYALMSEIGNDGFIDEGIIDTSSVERMIVTTAYGCLEQEIYNDEELSKLGNELDGHVVDDEEKQEFLDEIDGLMD